MLRTLATVAALALAACAAPGSLTVPQLPTQVDDPGPRERLRIVTYNLHWPRTDAGPRAPALLEALRAADADIVAFQELGTWFGDALEESGFAEEGGYAAIHLGGETVAPHRLLVLSRFPIRATLVKRLAWGNSSVVIARLEVNGRLLSVANVHFESRLHRKKVRVEQLKEVLALLGDDEAILLGDFNFGDEDEPESSTLPAEFLDVWRAVKRDDPGLTWNREQNPWARANSYDGEPSRRLDRILIRSARLVPEEAELLGVEPARGSKRHPSDHFGLAATVRDLGPALELREAPR